MATEESGAKHSLPDDAPLRAETQGAEDGTPTSALTKSDSLKSVEDDGSKGSTDAMVEIFELPGSTFASDRNEASFEDMPQERMISELGKQMAEYLASYYPEHQHGLFSKYSNPPPPKAV